MQNQNKESKMFLNIAYITKVNIASLNGAEGSGGNITPIKKVSSYDGEEFVYVSGQALRHYLKETLFQLGENIAEINEKGEPTFKVDGKYVNLDSKKEFDKYKKQVFKSVVDLDLFGYMFPKSYRRWSPVKVAPLLSLLPYKGEVDYLTRKQKGENKGGNIVQVEIDTLNFMRGNIVINLEHIGAIVDEFTYEKENILSDDEKKERINKLLEAIKNFNGGAKQARNLEDIAPKFIVITKQQSANPFFLNALKVDKNMNLDIAILKEAINEADYEDLKIGLRSGIFNNEKEIKDNFEVVGIKEAIEYFKEK